MVRKFVISNSQIVSTIGRRFQPRKLVNQPLIVTITVSVPSVEPLGNTTLQDKYKS
jgi:hypothetical protein